MLLPNFTAVDDLGLLNLAENSRRLENITKIVFNKRYRHEYFLVSDIKPVYDFETSKQAVQLFGNEMKAIAIKKTDSSDGNDWIVGLLTRTTNLEKLKLDIKMIDSNENLLQQDEIANVTHLTLRNLQLDCTHDGLILPKFGNLKRLELVNNPCISFKLLKEVIRNNPQLERLDIGDRMLCGMGAKILNSYPFDELMVVIGAHLKYLKVLNYIPISYGLNRQPNRQIRQQPKHIVDAFVDSLVHLETLALSSVIVNSFTNVAELLQRLAAKCENFNRLELHKMTDQTGGIQCDQVISTH